MQNNFAQIQWEKLIIIIIEHYYHQFNALRGYEKFLHRPSFGVIDVAVKMHGFITRKCGREGAETVGIFELYLKKFGGISENLMNFEKLDHF